MGSFVEYSGDEKMNKNILRELGDIAGEIAKQGIGKLPKKNQFTDKILENITDFIVEQATKALGGTAKKEGRNQGWPICQGRGRGYDQGGRK